MTDAPLLLTFLILIAALLYSSVGHGGASGYLAAMALFGLAPAVMKPTALVLNLLVAGLGTFRYARSGYFNWNVFWPFAMFSIPCAFFGGSYQLHDRTYRGILGAVLLFAAWRLAFQQPGFRLLNKSRSLSQSRWLSVRPSACSPDSSGSAGEFFSAR